MWMAKGVDAVYNKTTQWGILVKKSRCVEMMVLRWVFGESQDGWEFNCAHLQFSIFISKVFWNVMFSSLFVNSFIGISPWIHPISVKFQNTTWSLRLLRCRWLTLASKLVQRHLNGQKPCISFRWSRNPTSSTWILWCVHVAKVLPGYRRGIWMFDPWGDHVFCRCCFFWCFGRIKVAQHMKNVWSCLNLKHIAIYFGKRSGYDVLWRYETPFQERIYTTSHNKEIVISWEVWGAHFPLKCHFFPFQEMAGLIRGFLGDSGFMVVDPARQAQKLLQLQERLTRSQWRGKKKTGVVWHGLGWYSWNLVPPNHPF